MQDCAICFENLSTSAEDLEESCSSQNTEVFMETPCGHQFHSGCLTSWMDEKFQCPLCRSQIPPLED